MTKHLTLVCEAKLSTEKNEADQGLIEATVTTWGAREGADGRQSGRTTVPVLTQLALRIGAVDDHHGGRADGSPCRGCAGEKGGWPCVTL